jgi:acetylornithine/N-succinyldiaminopimelate aminotransferase
MKPFDVYPVFGIEPVKARGAYIWDNTGEKYLDLYGGHAVISIGHSHPLYISRLGEQLGRIAFYSNTVLNSLQEELAHKLGELSGYPEYDLFLCNSGAEANENAFKLASFHTGRKKIIAFKGSFHGRTSLAVAATDDPSIISPVNDTGNVVLLPLNDIQALERNMDGSVAAVIVEGIQGVGGIRVPESDFLQKLRTLCDVNGALLITDEVQSGCGRTGRFFAHQHTPVRADLITVAKGIGNGFPVGGVLIHPRVKARHGMLGTTFGGSYLACTAAIAVLDVIKEEGLMENAGRTGAYIMDSLKGVEGVRDVRGKGLMLGIELDMPIAELRKELLTEHKIFTGASSDKNTMRLLPPLGIGREEAQVFLDAFRQVLIKKQTVCSSL